MKRIFIILIILCFISSTVYGTELLKLGDNLIDYLQQNPVKYEMQLKPISGWPEGKAKAFAYTKKTDGTTPIIMVVNDIYPIGVLQGVSPNAYYLLDVDGDGILDTRTDNIVLPYWVISKTSVNKTKNDNISKILDIAYQGYQNDEGPLFSTIMVMQAIEKYKTEVNSENRDLVYLIDFYNTYNQKFLDESLNAITILENEIKNRFNKEHPLILLYKLETLINLKQNAKARELVKELRKMDPEFVPGMVYEYQLEDDEEKAEVLLANLKNNHEKHWIVKQL